MPVVPKSRSARESGRLHLCNRFGSTFAATNWGAVAEDFPRLSRRRFGLSLASLYSAGNPGVNLISIPTNRAKRAGIRHKLELAREGIVGQFLGAA